MMGQHAFPIRQSKSVGLAEQFLDLGLPEFFAIEGYFQAEIEMQAGSYAVQCEAGEMRPASRLVIRILCDICRPRKPLQADRGMH